MRLIDADDLIKAFEALDLMNGQYAESVSNMAGNRSMEIESAINYIENAKTIDAKPIVHAHWIKQEHELFKCSNCGNYLDFRGVNAGRGDANYCPNCGTKMVGRPLRTGEIVHHIDGNKRNNEPSNLMVMTQSEHCRLHFSKKGGDE